MEHQIHGHHDHDHNPTSLWRRKNARGNDGNDGRRVETTMEWNLSYCGGCEYLFGYFT
jgi:hypothetical protein